MNVYCYTYVTLILNQKVFIIYYKDFCYVFLGGVTVVIKNCIQKILIVIGQRKMKGNQLKCKKCPKIISRK